MKQEFETRIVQGVVGVVLVVAVFFTGSYVGRHGIGSTTTKGEAWQYNSALVQDSDFAAFWKAWKILDQKYVGTSSSTPKEKVWGAIKGLVASEGDPYTVFFPPEESKLFEEDIAGNFDGVGMEIGLKDGILTVVTPIKDSPSAKAGMRTGDKIIKIDGQSVLDTSVDAAVKKIRGPKGSTVTLTILREGHTGEIEKVLTRDTIKIPTIETEIKPADGNNGSTTASVGNGNSGLRADGIFIIRLLSFTAESPNLFRDALRNFLESGSQKLIIDLRGNPGGYLEAAWDIVSWFLPSGKVIVTEDFGKASKPVVYRSKGYNVLDDRFHLVVLVNGGSASAAEIMAGALQEHGVATLVGTKTFGKGSVQELVKITPETSLKVTIARWLTPKGHNLSKSGLIPDVEVPITQKDIDAKRDPQLDKAISILKAF